LSFRVADWMATPAWSWPDPSWFAETVLKVAPGPASSIAVIDGAGRISLVDPLLGVIRATTAGRGPRLSSTLRFSHDASLLASLGGGAGNFDGDALVVWDANQQKVLWSLNDVYWLTAQDHHSSHAFAFSADDKTLFVISSDGTVRVLDALTGSLLRRFGKNASCVATSPYGAEVYTCGNDVSAVGFAAYRVSDGSLVSSVDDQLGRMSGLAVSPQGTHLGMALREGGVVMYRLADKKQMWKIAHDAALAPWLVFSPDGQMLAVTRFNTPGLRVYDTQRGTVLLDFKPTKAMGQADFSPDGRFLGVQDEDGIDFIRTSDMSVVDTLLPGVNQQKDGLAFSPVSDRMFANRSLTTTVSFCDVVSYLALRP